jgi:hypothetical protein
MDVVKTRFVRKDIYWGRVCNVCGRNYSIMEQYDKIFYANGTSEEVQSWSSSLCNCRYVCKYRNGEFVYRDKDDPIYKKFKHSYENRLKERNRVG